MTHKIERQMKLDNELLMLLFIWGRGGGSEACAKITTNYTESMA